MFLAASASSPMARAESLVLPSSCEQSVSQVGSLLGFLTQGWKANQISVEEIIVFRDFLISEVSEESNSRFRSGPTSAGLTTESQLRARVLWKLTKELSKAELNHAAKQLTALIEEIKEKSVERALTEERTAKTHERLDFLPVKPGPTTVTYYGIINNRQADHYIFKVRIAKRFWAAETRVSRGHWQTVMGTPPRRVDGVLGPDDPITDLTGKEVDAFIQRMNQFRKDSDPRLLQVTLASRPGLRFVLLSNAQWTLFADQWENELPHVFPTFLSEFVQDEVIVRRSIPRWIGSDPLYIDQDKVRRRLVVGHELNNQGLPRRCLHLNWEDSSLSPNIGFRLGMVEDSTEIFEKVWNWLMRRGNR